MFSREISLLILITLLRLHFILRSIFRGFGSLKYVFSNVLKNSAYYSDTWNTLCDIVGHLMWVGVCRLHKLMYTGFFLNLILLKMVWGVNGAFILIIIIIQVFLLELFLWLRDLARTDLNVGQF
jgi:hypothetical protein